MRVIIWWVKVAVLQLFGDLSGKGFVWMLKDAIFYNLSGNIIGGKWTCLFFLNFSSQSVDYLPGFTRKVGKSIFATVSIQRCSRFVFRRSVKAEAFDWANSRLSAT